jgi:gluconolactonase
MEIREIASGLEFPEGPVAMPDGSVVLVEIHRGTLSRVTPEGKVEVVAELGGGPNGAAVGPDGAVYVCNDGGFIWSTFGDYLIPLDLTTGANEPPDFKGGWIEKVALDTGQVTRLYSECDGHVFRSPNDIVFDSTGGFWFTDLGKMRPRELDRGGLYYAQPDGSSVVEAAFGLMGPNGVGLSPDGNTVYVAESFTGHLVAWDLDGPGQLRKGAMGHGGRVVAATKGHFDSLAVEEDGNIVVAALPEGLCVITPEGAFDYVAFPDPMTTNVCFGGPDRRTAFVTMSAAGKLVAADWPRAGLELAFGGP